MGSVLRAVFAHSWKSWLIVALAVSFALPVNAAVVTLTVIGTPATGSWGVLGSVADARDVMTDVMLDGVLHHTEHDPPYGFPSDNGTTAVPAKFGNGPHTVEFIFKLEGTATEIGRGSIAVIEGAPMAVPGQAGAPTVTLRPSVIFGSAILGWTANTEADLAGYKIYMGTAPRTYDSVSGLPKDRVTATANNLVPGKTYYFGITAIDTSGNESPFSNEVSKTIP